jgi:hypothetical protein
VPGIGANNVIIAQSFALNESETSGVLEHAGQFYVIRTDEKVPLDVERFASNLQNFKISIVGTKQQIFISNWYQNLRSDADIEDYRSFGSNY